MRQLNWTQQARADLRKINGFLSREANGEIAARMLLAIRQRADLLLDFPHAGPPVEDQAFRSLKVLNTPFVIAYRLLSTSIEILRVHHTAQNWRDTPQ